MDNNFDEIFMEEAIKLALLAAERDEVPVGAVAVRDGKIIASAYNTREESNTCHRKSLCGSWRLETSRCDPLRHHGALRYVCRCNH